MILFVKQYLLTLFNNTITYLLTHFENRYTFLYAKRRKKYDGDVDKYDVSLKTRIFLIVCCAMRIVRYGFCNNICRLRFKLFSPGC